MLKLLLQIIAPVRCLCCQKNALLCCPEHLSEPGEESVAGIPVHYLFPLDQPRLRVMTAFKDRGVTALAPVIGSAMTELLSKLDIPHSVTLVIPPKNKSNYRKRGYHPVQLIAKRLGMPVVSAKASKAILDQRQLSAEKRGENLRGAFYLEGLYGKQVVVFDDVLTTGATLRELIRASEEAGAEVIAGCVVARRFPDFAEGNLKKA